MPTFGGWEATVLELAYDQVDLISCHAYYEEKDGDLAGFLASAVDMDAFIEAVVATADHVRAKVRGTKRINLSFDEWNVWYVSKSRHDEPHDGWPVAPRLIEDEYNVADAVVVGGLLISLLRHSDRVTAACLAQLVNAIAPIRTEPGGPAWRQTTFHPFAQAARYALGSVLRAEVAAPSHETAAYGEVTAVDAVATHDEDSRTVTVFAVNRHPEDSVMLDLDLRGFPGYELVEHCVLSDHDIRAANTLHLPDRVTPRRQDATGPVAGGRLNALLPAVSWNVLRLRRVDGTVRTVR
jgi:alpha-N-arabinofuranosidase